MSAADLTTPADDSRLTHPHFAGHAVATWRGESRLMILKRILIGAVGLYLLVGVVLWAGQRRLLYDPDPTRVAPQSLGLTGVEERVIATPDGNRLIAWWGPARPGRPTLLYFHGNGGMLARRAERIRFLHEQGLGVFMMSYRGYSGSTGTPSEANNVADAKLAYDELRRLGVEPARIVLYGESLGTGVATQLAAHRPVSALILDSPFTSITDIGAARYPYLPVRLLLLDRYDTESNIRNVHVPVLIIHGEADRIVPVEMGRAVYAAAKEPKQIATFPGAGHTNHVRHGSYQVVLEFIAGIERANGSPALSHTVQ